MMAAVCVSLRAACGQFVSARLLHLSASTNKVVQFNLSDIGEGIREVTVKGLFVKVNDVVAQFDDVCEVESDKATVTITSRFDGRVTRVYHGVGDTALVGQPLLDVDVPDEGGDSGSDVTVSSVTSDSYEQPKPVSSVDQPSSVSWNKSLATPAVRRIAMENNIKLSEVKATGKNGRVLKEDILAFVENIKEKSTKTSLVQNTTIEPLSQVQRIMAKNLTKSTQIPHFVFSDEIDVSKLVKLMSDAKEAASKKDIKLSYVPIFLKAISKGLLEYPILNSSYDEEGGHIIYKHYHNIGIAIDSPNGLLVPNVKNVQDLSILQISKELNRLKGLASQLKLSPSDLTGGTFSLSNIGSIAGISGTPTILPPQVCIVAIGRIQKLPRFDSTGNVVAANIIHINWTADHRLLDGATVARCSQVFKFYMENPTALLLDL